MRLIDVAIDDYRKEFQDPDVLETVLTILRTGYKCGLRDQKSGEINWDFVDKTG